MEHFITDTAKYADYVFPATTQLEHLDLMVSYGHQYISLNMPAIVPQGESIPNTEFFRRLARKLDLKDDYLYKSDEDIIKTLLDKDHPYLKNITYEKLVKVGWMPLNLPERFPSFAEGNFQTPSGKCEFYSESLKAQGLDPLPTHTSSTENTANQLYPLILLTPKSTNYFLNSSHANQKRHLKQELEPRIQMNVQDADSRAIKNGDMVSIYNQRGVVNMRVEVSENIRSKIVAIPHGWWHAGINGNASTNILTADHLTDIGGGAGFHDTWVQVEKKA